MIGVQCVVGLSICLLLVLGSAGWGYRNWGANIAGGRARFDPSRTLLSDLEFTPMYGSAAL